MNIKYQIACVAVMGTILSFIDLCYDKNEVVKYLNSKMKLKNGQHIMYDQLINVTTITFIVLLFSLSLFGWNARIRY